MHNKNNPNLKQCTFEERYVLAVEQPLKTIKEKVDSENIDSAQEFINFYFTSTQKYGITITLKPEYHTMDSLTMHRKIEEYFAENFDNVKYIIIAEFTKKAVIHWHGIIYNEYQLAISQKISSIKNVYGFIQMEWRISPHWEKYIIKDIGTTGLWPIISQ